MTTIEAASESLSHLERLWNAGQQHLVVGRYVAARTDLEAAEAVAWRRRDALSLGKIYLPLLEARRQIRQNAAEGVMMIWNPRGGSGAGRALPSFLRQSTGTALLTGENAVTWARLIAYATRRSGACLEALLLVKHGRVLRICSPGDSYFAAGLDVRVTSSPGDMIAPDVLTNLTVPLPPPGIYAASHPLHPVARESLLVAWEALAIKWQARHRVQADPWAEIAWLRRALRIDPAAEPITMRLIALAEVIARNATR